MAKLSPWSVKGIDEETREIARTAARESGLTIGEWVNRTILENALGPVSDSANQGAAAEPPPPPSGTTESAAVQAWLDQPPIGDGGQGEPETGAPTASPEPTDPTDTADTGATASVSDASPIDAPPIDDSNDGDAETAKPAADPVSSPETMVEEATGPSMDGTPAENGDHDEFQMPEPAPERVDDGLGASAAQLAPGLAANHAHPPAQPRLFRNLIVASVLLVAVFVVIWGIDRGDETAPADAPGTAGKQPAADAKGKFVSPGQATRPATPDGSAGPSTTQQAGGADGSGDRIRQLSALALQGDARAQYDLGVARVSGSGIARDERLAANWFKKSALQGISGAQYNMGVLRERGRGVPKDEKLAYFWYASAAEQNHARAQYNLAVLYAEGRGTTQSYTLAKKWFTRAAELGLSAAQYSLGTVFEHGYGTKMDRMAADRWYRAAAAQGHGKAAKKLNLPVSSASPTVTAITPGRVMPTSQKPQIVAISKRLDRREIAEIQGFLTRLNFDAGPSDGIMGGQTTAAIRLYQQFAGLNVDGVPSAELLRDLRQAVGAMAPPQR